MPKSPMLAERDSLHNWPTQVSFPLYALPKLDGFRCIVSEGKAVTRSFSDIVNNYTRGQLSQPDLSGLDGELVVGPLNAENVFNVTSSGVTRIKGEPLFEWHVFDDFTDPLMPYNERQVRVCERMIELGEKYPFLRMVEPCRLETYEGLEQYEDMVLGMGYEGVITRKPSGLYKFGRSTKRDQGMLKLKRFTDAEAEVIGFVELMRNTNPDVRDNFGRAKRSKAQDGLVPGGTLGTLECRDLLTGIEFEIGMFKGLSSEDKQAIWDNRDDFMGKLVKYQHLAHGAVDKPRHSKFLGWRDRADL